MDNLLIKISDRGELERLEELPMTENKNYIKVLEKIPSHFKAENDVIKCMMLAFSYGELKGRECERNQIEWNSTATFYNMKIYASMHNGELPKTLDDLVKWEKEIIQITKKS